MDWYLRKIAYIWLRFSEWLVGSVLFIYSMIYKCKKENIHIQKIGAYWYYPPDLTGSNLRLGGWKKHFEKINISYHNFHINTLQDFVDNVENGTWTKKYLFFSKCLWRRLPQLLKAHKFDVLWIDRSLIPYYPRKYAFIEKRINRVVQKVVIDSTDGGDYLGNPKLMDAVYRSADQITVGYKYLLNEFEKKYKNVTQIYWTIPHQNYIQKNNYEIGEKAVIGWMGSPENFKEVLKIINVLSKLNKEIPFTFSYICRKNFNHKLQGIDAIHHKFDENYYSIIASFDIGISPFLKKNMSTKGKIAMKHQEFLLMGTPQVCSDVALSEFVIHKEHVLIAKGKEEWHKHLQSVLTRFNLRKKLGENSKLIFHQNYTYTSQFNSLKKVLTNY